MNHEKIIDDETRLDETHLYRPTPNLDGFTFTNKVTLVVSINSHPTERISQFVDQHLRQLVQTTQSFFKGITHFLNKLEQLDQLRNNALLVTLHVSSLYTNIPHTESINACRHFLDTRDRSASTNRTLDSM